jgi:hypothetical protein
MLVGRITSNWSLFETMIDMAMWHIAGIDDNSGGCLTAQIAGFARELDALIALFHHHHLDDTSTQKRCDRWQERAGFSQKT